jgi:predicted nucleotidyltransferase component of viral defense system
MIPESYIIEWRNQAPWPEDYQVEQDLVIERALVDVFSRDIIQSTIAFRGGTALHKLYLQPQVRYSEDIDLVQVKSGPIRETLAAIQESLSYLGKSSTQQTDQSNKIFFRYESEIPPKIRLRLKIEINTREHFSVFEIVRKKREFKSGWFNGSADIYTFQIEELLATKLRALYQRRKGRDLFDIYYAFQNSDIDVDKLLHAYDQYIGILRPSASDFELNLNAKSENDEFLNDMASLLRPGVKFDPKAAKQMILEEIIFKM